MTAQAQERLTPPQLSPAEQSEVNRIVAVAQTATTHAQFEHVLFHAIMMSRSFVVRTALAYMAPTSVINTARLLSIADFVWLGMEPYWNRMIKPVFMAQIYASHAASAKARIPEHIVGAMADDYVKRLGKYYTSTSGEALVDGFNAYVNRRVPIKVAADRALAGWGLTKRQMNAVVAAELDAPVTTVRHIDPRSRMKRYILRHAQERSKIISKQETYNISQEAMQVNWLYQQKRGLLPESTKRVWVTARDEMVCPTCGPMHLKEVGLTEYFVVDGVKMWVPGVHVQCRCRMRLKINTVDAFSVSKAGIEGGNTGWDSDDWDPEEHPRDKEGQFTRKNTALARAQDTRVKPLGTTAPLTAKPVLGRTQKPLGTAPAALGVTTPLETVTEALVSNPALTRTLTPLQIDALATAKVDMLNTVQQNVQHALKVTAPPKTKVLYKNTIMLDNPVYAVIDEDEATFEYDEHGEITGAYITNDTEFVPEERVYPEVNKYVDRAQDDIRYDLDADRERLEVFDRVDGFSVSGVIPDEAVELAMYAATKGAHLENNFYDVPVFNRDIGKQHITMSYAEILGRMQVDPTEMIPKVFVVNELHADAVTHDPGSRHGFETWRSSGAYDAEVSYVTTDGFNTVVEVVTLTPRLEPKKITD